MNPSKPILLTSILTAQTIAVLAYTLYVGTDQGWNFLEVALQNLQSLSWIGQFTIDFSCYLTLSGMWIMWRNAFSASGIVLAVVVMILGIIVFAPYVLYLIAVEKGDLKKVLLGKQLMA